MKNAKNASFEKLSKKDLASEQEVRWCPGCGNYLILESVKKALIESDIPRENIVFVSGIGCSSRLPYYINTYGFHGIHGRAPALATGIKLANPKLSVWVITGDGDGLSIGLNHLVHLMRRNIDINILLFNNKIYSLTKGQFSPTSPLGKITKSSPSGSKSMPLEPVKVALASNCGFIARALDSDTNNLVEILKNAISHKGTSFIEVLQNCKIFNDKSFAEIEDNDLRKDNTIMLQDKKPLVFGKNENKILKVSDSGLNLEVAENKNNAYIYNTNQETPNLANVVANLKFPKFPLPLGIFRAFEKSTYEELLQKEKNNNEKSNMLFGRDVLKDIFCAV